MTASDLYAIVGVVAPHKAGLASSATETVNLDPESKRTMSRKAWSISIASLGIVLLIALTLAACQPTAPQQVPAAETAAAAEPAVTAEIAPTGQATDSTPTTGAEATDSPTAAGEAAGAEDAPQTAGTPLRFQIVPEGTEVRFLIDEVLMGQEKTVVGVTSLVTGDITVDPANPAAAQVSEIRVDASSLATDDNRRNGRLRNDILKSSTAQYQYVVFEPTSIAGMPASITVGTPFTFQLTGDLTILDTTAPVTFDMTVTPVSTSQLTGSGSAAIRHADFGINIPSVPMVAGVGEEVRLEIDLTAQANS